MNAKQELLDCITRFELADILSAEIKFEYDEFTLSEGYTDLEYEEFLSFIDRHYDNGYGLQELFGHICFEDCILTRAEYDGSEWWDVQ